MTKKPKKTKRADPDEGRKIPLVWIGVEECPVRASNNALCQVIEDMFVLTFGFTNSPVLLGSPEEIKGIVETITSVTVTPVARVGFTAAQAERVLRALQESVEKYKTAHGAE